MKSNFWNRLSIIIYFFFIGTQFLKRIKNWRHQGAVNSFLKDISTHAYVL